MKEESKEHIRKHHRKQWIEVVPFPHLIASLLGCEPHELLKPRCTFAELGKDCPAVRGKL